MSEKKIKQTINRIINISWENNDKHLYSHIALIREYLRRAALWARSLSVQEEWPFFNISAYINKNILLPEIEELEQHLEKFLLTGLIKKTCKWSVYWSGIEENDECIKFNLPVPYEPLIRLYERGGKFTKENVFINIFEVGLPLKNIEYYLNINEIADLDDQSLDEIDMNNQ